MTDEPDTGEDSETTEQIDWQAEAERWKNLSRKHEDRAKQNANAARELEELRRSTMSETEKAVEAARLEGRQAALAEASRRLAAAEFRAVAAGRLADPDAAVELLDTSRFLTDDGDVDREAVAKAVERLGAPAPRFPAVDLGPRGTNGSTPDFNTAFRRIAGKA